MWEATNCIRKKYTVESIYQKEWQLKCQILQLPLQWVSLLHFRKNLSYPPFTCFSNSCSPSSNGSWGEKKYTIDICPWKHQPTSIQKHWEEAIRKSHYIVLPIFINASNFIKCWIRNEFIFTGCKFLWGIGRIDFRFQKSFRGPYCIGKETIILLTLGLMESFSRHNVPLKWQWRLHKSIRTSYEAIRIAVFDFLFFFVGESASKITRLFIPIHLDLLVIPHTGILALLFSFPFSSSWKRKNVWKTWCDSRTLGSSIYFQNR